jgi:predicted ester cyclase
MPTDPEHLKRNKQAALDSFRIVTVSDSTLAELIISPNCINREAEDDPEDVERNLQGPNGFIATSEWLRSAFTDLRFEFQEVVAEGDVVVVASTMLGQHTGEFQHIAPTGNRISQKQVHVFRIGHDGKIVEHRAVRDDLSLMFQLGRHFSR